MSNYFKNRQEVEQFFKNQTFEFSFSTDNTLYFDTLQPIILDGELYKFQLSFYNDNGSCFFRHSSFCNWLDNFQLAEVTKISEQNKESEILYFEKYKENN
jgi:hypothetical protein